jgi:hypothetical protein
MSKSVAGFEDRFEGKVIELDFEIVPTCNLCGKPLKVKSRSEPRYVVGVDDNYQIVKVYRVCGNSMCPGCLEKPVFVPNPYVKPRCTFDIEVQALICKLRWIDHKTEEEIVNFLWEVHEIKISMGHVGNILKMYEIGCSQAYKPEFVKQITKNGGIILTVDAMEPLKGEHAIYMVRDELTGLKLGTKRLPNGKTVTIEKFLKGVKKSIEEELKVPVMAIICDAQKEQKAALESVFPGVKICLCGFHFYKNILKEPMAADSTMMKTIRSMLRKVPVIKEYRLRISEQSGDDGDPSLVDECLDLLLNLSNWTRKPRDPCFSGLELRDRVKDVFHLVCEMHGEAGSEIFTPDEEKQIKRIKKDVNKCLRKTQYAAAGLKRVKVHLEKIVEILDAPKQTSKEGLARFTVLAEELVEYAATGRRTKFEKGFVGAFCKYVETKGELLFNHLDVEGAPLTNNNHELTHMAIKHQLRRIIGHKAASHYLLAHGERILFVDPNESLAGITRILSEMDQAAAMRLIESERKPRSAISIVMHVVDKWKKKITSLWEKLANLRRAKPTIT